MRFKYTTLITCSLALLLIAGKRPPVSRPADKEPKEPPLPAGTVIFAPLGISDAITTMTATEDGHYVLFAAETADRITVWDVAANKAAATLACTAPRPMICRNGHLYVGSFGHGKVLVFDEATWKQTDELLTGANDVRLLSAPTGKAFHNQILACCGGPRNSITSVIIDTAADTHREFDDTEMVAFTNDGKFIYQIIAGSALWSTADWMAKGKQAKTVVQGYIGTSFAYQPINDSLLLTDHDVYGIGDLAAIKKDLGDLVFADRTQPLIYAINAEDGKLTASAATATLDVVGKCDFAISGEAGKKRPNRNQFKDQLSSNGQYRRDRIDAPIAITLQGTLHLYFHDGHRAVVQATTMPAFKASDIVVDSSAAEGGTASAQTDFPALPESIPPGKPFLFALHPPANAALQLITGPKGMTLGENSTLTWTPPADEAGASEPVKIRVTQGDQTSFIRYTLNVAGNANMASKKAPAAPGQRNFSKADPAVASAIQLPFEQIGAASEYAFAPSLSGKATLVISGNTLYITDPTGTQASQTLTLPRRYNRLMERDAYYVGLSASTLDLVDKQSLKVLKSIRLNTAETYDLALHPTLRIAYVSLHDETQPGESSALARKVVAINETSETIAPIEGVAGQWLTIDPKGSYLVVGLHDVYQTGEHLDFSYEGWVAPTFGNIDVLGMLPLHNGTPQRGRALTDPGVGGRAVRVSPDGKNICYVSFGGRPANSYAVPALSARNLKDISATYSMKGRGAPEDLCFHPTLPLVAIVGGDGVAIFDRNTGDRLDGKVGDIPIRNPENSNRVMFSPDGRSVVIDPMVNAEGTAGGGGRKDSARRLIALPLKLTDAEIAQLGQSAPAAPKSTPAPPGAISSPVHPKSGAGA